MAVVVWGFQWNPFGQQFNHLLHMEWITSYNFELNCLFFGFGWV